MADWKSLLLAALTVCLPLQSGAEQRNYLARQEIKADVLHLSDPQPAASLVDNASAIMSRVGLIWAAPALPDTSGEAMVPDTAAVVELVDIRLLLTQIAIQTGAQDHVALIRAQGDRSHNVILLRGGFASLSDLENRSEGTPAQEFISRTPEGVVLTRPLAIWTDAGLALGAEDHLILDQESGSFIANLGWLDVSGGSITGNATPNSAEPGFRPFLLTAGQGSFSARNASFQALGFGKATVFGGIVVVNSGLVTSRFLPVVTGSTLDDVKTLGLIGTSGAILADNDISGSTGPAMLVSGARKTTIAANRLSGLSGAQAIRVTAGAAGVQVIGNLVSGAARMGIHIDQDSQAVSIDGNLVTGNLKAGIAVDRATCVMIVDNLVAANQGSGISLSDSVGTTALNNAILFNLGSGVLLRDQAAKARVRLAGNVFIGNRDGLHGATSGQLSLERNDLDGQMPRAFGGDLARLTADWLNNRALLQPASDLGEAINPCTADGKG